MTTTPWEDLFPDRQLVQLAMPRQAAAYDQPDAHGHSCLVWDEDVERQAPADADQPRVTTLDFRSQDDKGPYHWAQGPQDVSPVAGQPPPTPKPPPTPTPTLPKKGRAITTANLRLRVRAGSDQRVRGVIPAGSTVQLTGGRRRVDDGALWVRVVCRREWLAQPTGRLQPPDEWLRGTVAGWVHSGYLAMPDTEYDADEQDFPPVTHEFRFRVESALDLDVATVAEALNAIMTDPRGPRRSGLLLRQVGPGEEPHVLVRLVQSSCGGAAGCYYKQSGQTARVDINREYWGTSWFSRVAIHELAGHGATRSYDHYRGAPDYPRNDYYGIMGNWQDAFGDHAWPDEDDCQNWAVWLQGASPVVMPRR